MPQRTRYGHSRQSNLRAAPRFLTPEKVGKLIGFLGSTNITGAHDVPATIRPDCTPVLTGLDTSSAGDVAVEMLCEAGDSGIRAIVWAFEHAKVETAPPISDPAEPPVILGRSGSVIVDEVGYDTLSSAEQGGPEKAQAPQPVVDNKKTGSEPTVVTACRPDRRGGKAIADATYEAIKAAASAARARRAAQRSEMVAPASPAAPITPSASPAPRRTDWIGRRHELLASAIAFLKARAILVTIVDRHELVRKYRISGKRFEYLAENVLDYAAELGWEVPSA